MDQFDRSPEDVSFDLDAEEFSLESILDEYKDFQTDAPAPRPQPAYPRRPVKAEMVEEDAAEDAEAEDILMSAELDSALEDTAPETGTAAPDEPPHEDHDVKRYQPKRQRDHATEEEIEKWNETKANAKCLAKKGISGLKRFASKISDVVPDEPVQPEEEPPEEDTAIPVSAPPEVPEGLYDPEPEEPTRVFQAVTEEGMDDSAAGRTAYARAGDYAADDGADGPARRSFQDAVLNPLMARLAAVAYRIREHNSAVHASANTEEELGPEPDAETAAKYYGGQVKSLRFRCRAAMIVCIPLIYISLGLPVFGVLKSNSSVAALVCLMMQLTVMLIGLDVITNGFFNLVRRTPGLESLVFLNCVFSALDAVVLAITGSDAVGLPFCAVSAFSVACCLWSALNTCRGFKSTFRTLAVDKDPYTVSADSEVVKDSITVLKSKRDTAGFIHRSEEAGPADTIYAALAPYLIAASVILGLLATILSGNYANILHVFAAVTAPCAPFAALVAFAIPFRTAARKLARTGSAIAGWSGASDIGRSKHLIVTDKDLFTARNISIEDIRILDGAFPDKVISYTGSVIVASGSCLATAFTDLMQRNNCTLMPVESFTCNESGGLSALVNGEEVLVGSSAFMNLKGVHLPQQLSAKNVVFTSINGLFVASFKIKYVPVQSVQNALFALLRTKIAPIFAVRDFNITPLMLGQKFKMSTDGFDFPAYRKRYAMSAAEPSDYTQTAGIVARDGLGPLVSVANLGRQLYSTVRICVILALLCTVIGVVLMFALCAIGAFDSATVGNLFVYMGLWLVPVILLNFSLKR
ncbi:MAG TPA: hypothetical protein OIM37_10020 [Clostridiales bacterium]|nr:hypothetical protein [Clostridiales bacterium]